MRRASLKILGLFGLFWLLFSCSQKAEEYVIEPMEPRKPMVDFGFNFDDFNVHFDTIRSQDTFERILKKQNLNGRKPAEIIAKVKDSFPTSVRFMKPYICLRSKDKYHKLQYLIYQPNKIDYYLVDLTDSIVGYKKSRPLTFKVRTIAGKLDGSLSTTLRGMKVDPSLSNKLLKVYAWSIDFFKLKKGDRFAVSFTERYINDTIYDGVDSLRCAFFEYKGDKIYAFPFQQERKGRTDYYDENGKALKNFFLKAPLKYIHITSRFSKSRFHPVQLRWKAHNGTDYAAPTGTPIMTTASGVVEQAGYTAGNGNFVKVKHDRTYATQYLHMSRILVRRGQRVKQGDVIGKVGSTGLATGPHVCYRFWKNGVQVDPLRIQLPNAQPMEGRNLPRFKEQMRPLKRELDSVAQVVFKGR
ncbi:Murein DD-endopeptidase MepM and murein hydrolase activator NlpD, contain LysM domain [Flavobacterium fontis]|jgi:murein DD-endopeptidase MepM/ murein hydrolase activator NlpD|uniref:Murein DD-endopeptidase MepM and murein hydrolase activator NlpD, contain LysM domain n=2 Tax=Flavobacterium TaxID=237 RepID=A0A1M4YCN6_9FLAO|nr:peptidoglycan DD-metalloendopeptidase family protein [Flavobacterium sp.]MCZ8169275.1 peptidoglycan DD-metalloendopeptidase family protein [Flavobacterium sp.]MCZ8297389.1 peptidoglycan DD-metalloendopeptidase family protein [Flavobacterium sp.]SHF03554.1 Murein DD-endopeptidase MepM and murein hydrolase activator NlpD, contain LysM domain [Flavobacterium fontis]